MNSAYFEFDDVSYLFECVTSETGEHTSTATEHNVEKGANVSDHIRPGLDKVSLEVFVSNTPLTDVNGLYGLAKSSVELDVPSFKQSLSPTPGALINAAASAIGDLISGKPTYKAQFITYGGPRNVPKDVVTQLDDWRLKGVVGKVVTAWKTYESVIIEHVGVKRDASMGEAVTITIDLREIRMVETKMVTVPIPTETRGKTMVNKGRQAPTEVPAGDESILLATLKRIVPIGR